VIGDHRGIVGETLGDVWAAAGGRFRPCQQATREEALAGEHLVGQHALGDSRLRQQVQRQPLAVQLRHAIASPHAVGLASVPKPGQARDGFQLVVLAHGKAAKELAALVGKEPERTSASQQQLVQPLQRRLGRGQ
jgi:hypothetical protein